MVGMVSVGNRFRVSARSDDHQLWLFIWLISMQMLSWWAYLVLREWDSTFSFESCISSHLDNSGSKFHPSTPSRWHRRSYNKFWFPHSKTLWRSLQSSNNWICGLRWMVNNWWKALWSYRGKVQCNQTFCPWSVGIFGQKSCSLMLPSHKRIPQMR